MPDEAEFCHFMGDAPVSMNHWPDCLKNRRCIINSFKGRIKANQPALASQNRTYISENLDIS